MVGALTLTRHANQVLIRYIQKRFGWVGLCKVSDNWVTGMFMFSLVPYSNHAVLFRTEYIRLLVHLTPTGRGSGRGRAQAEPSLRARARAQRFESLSRRKPGPSRGFEPKPSPHITRPTEAPFRNVAIGSTVCSDSDQQIRNVSTDTLFDGLGMQVHSSSPLQLTVI